MFDQAPKLTITEEARRQVEICNACRYCEGYCAVFPLGLLAARLQRRGHHPAGQPLPQLPRLLLCLPVYRPARVRPEPAPRAGRGPRRKLGPLRMAGRLRPPLPNARAARWRFMLVLGIAALFWALTALAPASGEGFYAYLSHTAMVAIFAPRLPSAAGGHRHRPQTLLGRVGGTRIRWPHLKSAFADAATMRQPVGRAAEGCNFRTGRPLLAGPPPRPSGGVLGLPSVLRLHVFGHGPALCLHMPAPYGLFSLPKLLGLPGGFLLTVGAVGLIALKFKADASLGAPESGAERSPFVALLGLTGLTGLMLYFATGTALVAPLLALHLGTVLAFFLTTPYSKMVHGFYRMAALIRDAQRKQAKACCAKVEPVLRFSNMRQQKGEVGRVNANERGPLQGCGEHQPVHKLARRPDRARPR